MEIKASLGIPKATKACKLSLGFVQNTDDP
jgi:hypothetical protein